MNKMLLACLLGTAFLFFFGGGTPVHAADASAKARNPVIWADVPDVAVMRVGDTYYMASTTMHMNPGLPIMKSKDLVNWEMISYAYETLGDNDALALRNGRSCYGAGSWAPSLRYHDGLFYATTFSQTSGKTHIYTTKDPEKEPWKEISFRPSIHDHSLWFEDDGRVYMLHGVGDIRMTELNPDLSGIKPDGFNEVIVKNVGGVANASQGLRGEGSQLRKINGKYYLQNICWPRGGMRTQVTHRADKLTGPWEGRVSLQDKGVAQGSLIDTPDGKWYALLFQDNGAVGRTPFLVPVEWKDGWPVMGIDGKVPMTLEIPAGKGGMANIVASDEFDRSPGERPLPLAWQWNHNPDARFWSLTERPGWLRLKNGRVDKGFLDTQNTLTQRTFGPECAGSVCIDVSNMRDGDVAGLGALQRNYGFVGVKMAGGVKSVVMVNADGGAPREVASVPLAQATVHLKIGMDFKDRTDRATFHYSLDGKQWQTIGDSLRMRYTLPHFMGYRFALFNYGAETAGGSVDFDDFRIDNARN